MTAPLVGVRLVWEVNGDVRRGIYEPCPLLVLPPSDLQEHLGQLLDSREGTDVAKEVGRETFAAHRWLIAARFPVFNAQFFGLMSENSAQKHIKINDIEAPAFRALLRFVYKDSLPEDTGAKMGSPFTCCRRPIRVGEEYAKELMLK